MIVPYSLTLLHLHLTAVSRATQHVQHVMVTAVISVSRAALQSSSPAHLVSLNVQMECSTARLLILVSHVMQLVNHVLDQLIMTVILVKVCLLSKILSSIC